MVKFESKINIDDEVFRLLKWQTIGRSEPDFVLESRLKLRINSMTREEKIENLAIGYVTGWYGDEDVTKRILKNLYDEVMIKANDLLKMVEGGVKN